MSLKIIPQKKKIIFIIYIYVTTSIKKEMLYF